ncbi:glycosyl hydrolase family 18 protein [Salibacterium halotolerans]|uniref:Spore germination protein n=1 Tax=Salibacterium halotolerans TaxID=1884432 RepID=A0A1I5WRM3_9BACI|nr:glycosyl hydrolase family 18 protein [Salibacterium halotolerans]SFQ22434.1 spore germination protein [Salibacterium halotolerans]
MQIHVVQPGESLWGIGQMYNVPYETIRDANQIPEASRLVVGQTLVIPFEGRLHWVMPGESVWEISQRYGVPFDFILRLNNLPLSAVLPVGFPLYIDRPVPMKPVVDVGAYLNPNITGDESTDVVNEVGEYLTYLQLFSYQMNRDGTLTSMDDQAIINTAYENRVVPLMVITNIEDGAFSTELAAAVLQNEERRNRMLDEALAIMQEKGFLGIDFDLEYVGAENREAYNELMREARARLDEYGYLLSSALAPKVEPGMTGDLYEGHDYAVHGELADFVFLMTYEWGYSGGPPQAVAPVDQVQRVIEYALTLMPADKIMLGMPLYGYDWTLPFVQGETQAEAIDHQQALQLALEYNAAISFDETAQSPYFTYYDETGAQHEVWFEDARTVQAKFNMIKENGLRGMFYWVLGWDFPQNWLLIEENFTVNKRL